MNSEDKVGFMARWSLFAQVALVTAASTAVRPMISYRAVELGASGAQIGLLATTFALLPVILAFNLGRRIDRRGPLRYQVVGSASLTLGSLAAILLPHLAALYVATAALGFGQLLSTLAQQAAIAGHTTVENRDRAFGEFTSATAVGLIAGPPVAALTAGHADRFGLSEGVVGLSVALLLSLAALIMVLINRNGSTLALEADPSRAPTHKLAVEIVRTRGMWQALLAGGTVLAALDLLSMFLPLWAKDRGISIGVVGVLLTIRGVFVLVSRLGLTQLMRVVGRRALLASALLAGAASLVALPFVGLVGAIVVMIVLGLGLGISQPLTMSWITAVAAPGTRGAALGLRATANRIGQATLPAAIAAVTAGIGADGVFWGAALILAGASAALSRAPMERPSDDGGEA